MATYREDRIRRLAHEIWEREGHPHGRDAEHWRLATEAYEAELAGGRFDDAGQPIEVGQQASHEGMIKAPVAAPKARRGRKPQADITPSATETLPVTKRKRRTKAEMAAAAAGIAGAAAAVVATMAATKRRRGTKAETADEAAPAATAAPRRARRTTSKTTLSAAGPAPDGPASDEMTGAIPDPSADRPSDVATDLTPDPGAEPPSDAVRDPRPE